MEEKAIEYVVNKLHGLGVAVSHEGIATVLDYMDEYYEREWEPGDDDILTCMVYTEEEKLAYIREDNPDIPHNVISAVLASESAFFGDAIVVDDENNIVE